MDAKLTTVPGPPGPPGLQMNRTPTALGSAWLSIRGRILGGLLLVLPVLITFWVVCLGFLATFLLVIPAFSGQGQPATNGEQAIRKASDLLRSHRVFSEEAHGHRI